LLERDPALAYSYAGVLPYSLRLLFFSRSLSLSLNHKVAYQ